MKHYQKEATIKAPLNEVWDYLADLHHFGRFNDYHHGLEFITLQHQGKEVAFKTRHTFLPLFPLPPLDTLCTVKVWKKNVNQAVVTILEEPYLTLPLLGKKTLDFTNHTQKYHLIDEGKRQTKFIYEVLYRGLPESWGAYYRYVNKKVEAIMEQELMEIKKLLEKAK